MKSRKTIEKSTKSRKTIEKSMKSRKNIEKSLKKAMEKGTWPIVPYGACHGVTGSVRGVGRGGKSRQPGWRQVAAAATCLDTGGSGCHLPGHRFEASRGCQMAGLGWAGWLVGSS